MRMEPSWVHAGAARRVVHRLIRARGAGGFRAFGDQGLRTDVLSTVKRANVSYRRVLACTLCHSITGSVRARSDLRTGRGLAMRCG